MSQPPFRGRGRAHGGYNPHYRPGPVLPPLPAAKDMMAGLDVKPVDTIDKRTLRPVGGIDFAGSSEPDFDAEEASDPTITDMRCVGSYNWVDAKAPTIIVPGSPGIWKEPALPLAVPRDIDYRAGKPVFVDQNGHRLPSSPLVPLFVAADVLAEAGVTEPVDWSSVDIITDRNGLRKLFRWATGSEKLNDFRIDVQVAGTITVILNRWEPRSVDHPHPAVYGYSFEHHATRTAPGCEGSTGHHRIVTYDFDGLQMVVRFEVDACLPDIDEPGPEEDDVDGLIDSFAATQISSSDAADSSSDNMLSHENLTIRRAGTLVPQSRIVELATRAAYKVSEYDWADTYPQLALSQTPHHILGGHERGTFTCLLRNELGGPKLTEEGLNAREGLVKLRAVLEAVQELAVEYGQKNNLSLICKDGELRVYERESAEGCLPKEYLERFEA